MPHIPQDYSIAFQWYLKSAEQGYAESQCSLGLLYQDAKGVKHNHDKARYWWGKAAEQGNELAQSYLKIYDGSSELQKSLRILGLTD